MSCIDLYRVRTRFARTSVLYRLEWLLKAAWLRANQPSLSLESLAWTS